jgi:hypothetical protein
VDLNDLHSFADWLAAQMGDGYTVISGPIPATAPDRCIGVMDYDPGAIRQENWEGNYPVQILCRGARDAEGLSSYNDAHGMADAVVPKVRPPDHKTVVALTGGHRALLTFVSGPHPLAADDNGRWRFSINVALHTVRA